MNDQPHEPTDPQPETDAAPNQAANHGGNGKIARLPKALRDQLNGMIRDARMNVKGVKRLHDPGIAYLPK